MEPGARRQAEALADVCRYVLDHAPSSVPPRPQSAGISRADAHARRALPPTWLERSERERGGRRLRARAHAVAQLRHARRTDGDPIGVLMLGRAFLELRSAPIGRAESLRAAAPSRPRQLFMDVTRSSRQRMTDRLRDELSVGRSVRGCRRPGSRGRRRLGYGRLDDPDDCGAFELGACARRRQAILIVRAEDAVRPPAKALPEPLVRSRSMQGPSPAGPFPPSGPGDVIRDSSACRSLQISARNRMDPQPRPNRAAETRTCHNRPSDRSECAAPRQIPVFGTMDAIGCAGA